jgi:hypothetical protein
MRPARHGKLQNRVRRLPSAGIERRPRRNVNGWIGAELDVSNQAPARRGVSQYCVSQTSAPRTRRLHDGDRYASPAERSLH